MELQFAVGNEERHELVYSWDQMWGRESLTLDGVPIIKSVRILSFNLVHSLDANVGESEKHLVHVEKRRALLFSGFRPQVVTAWVDGVQVAAGVSNLTQRQIRSSVIIGVVVGVFVVAAFAGLAASLVALLMNAS